MPVHLLRFSKVFIGFSMHQALCWVLGVGKVDTARFRPGDKICHPSKETKRTSHTQMPSLDKHPEESGLPESMSRGLTWSRKNCQRRGRSR